MARGKGPGGQTCKQLIKHAIGQLGSPCDAATLFQGVKKNWQGSEDTI